MVLFPTTRTLPPCAWLWVDSWPDGIGKKQPVCADAPAGLQNTGVLQDLCFFPLSGYRRFMGACKTVQQRRATDRRVEGAGDVESVGRGRADRDYGTPNQDDKAHEGQS